MNPVQPEELSALLDGELDTARAAEVRAQIQMDPALRLEFETLSASDAAWRAAADAGAFAPAVSLPVQAEADASASGEGSGWLTALAVAMGGLVVARAVLKLAGSDALGFALPTVSLLLLIAVVVWLARTSPHDVTRMQSATGERA